MSIIRDPSLSKQGKMKIEWVQDFMPALGSIRKRFQVDKPLEDLKIAMSIHLEAKTAYLALCLKEGGADVYATGCNPLSTQDDIAAGLASLGVNVYAWHGATNKEYKQHLVQTLTCKPNLIIDDGGDLVDILIKNPELAEEIIGGCEETTTGVNRLIARDKADTLPFPMMNVNDAKCKHYYDNKYGTGQSVWDAIMHTTNLLVAGKTVVVAGYGYCGRGVAMRAKGMGANVIVTEIDPIKALEASMDGCRVMTMDDAAYEGDIFVTTTGCKDVITLKHFQRMKNNAFLANAGHFNVEINQSDLQGFAKRIYPRRGNEILGFELENGNTLNLLAEGRLVNLASGDGHPAEIMDTSFAIQSLCLEFLAERGKELRRGVYNVPKEIDDEVAKLKLTGAGFKIDELTREQKSYLSSWSYD